MTMIRTETTKTITDTWYVHNTSEISSSIFYNNSHSFTIIFLLYLYTINILLSGEIISNE